MGLTVIENNHYNEEKFEVQSEFIYTFRENVKQRVMEIYSLSPLTTEEAIYEYSYMISSVFNEEFTNYLKNIILKSTDIK